MTAVLLCATDAGGVRNLAALFSALSRRGASVTFVTRSAMRGLFSTESAAASVRVLDAADGAVRGIVESLRPSVVVCGTTRHPSPDREVLADARRAGVRSVAVVDEWYNYRYRFAHVGSAGALCLPDAIALPDDQAVCEALAEDLPSELCHPTGSPSLAAIWDCAARWRASPPPLPQIVQDAGNRPVITFLSETHAADYGSSRGESGSMGAFLGYTEWSVRDALLAVAALLPKKVLFVEKPHPSAIGVLAPDRIPPNVEYRMTRDAPTFELCFHSEAVVGMRSMALLEARLLKANVASFQPGRIGGEQCTAVRRGLIPSLATADDMLNWLERAIRNSSTSALIERPPFARPDAAQRIVQLALGDEQM